MTPLFEKKLWTTEKVTTRDEVQKSTDNFITSGEVFKGSDEVHRSTDNITTNQDVDKGTKNWNI